MEVGLQADPEARVIGADGPVQVERRVHVAAVLHVHPHPVAVGLGGGGDPADVLLRHVRPQVEAQVGGLQRDLGVQASGRDPRGRVDVVVRDRARLGLVGDVFTQEGDQRRYPAAVLQRAGRVQRVAQRLAGHETPHRAPHEAVPGERLLAPGVFRYPEQGGSHHERETGLSAPCAPASAVPLRRARLETIRAAAASNATSLSARVSWTPNTIGSPKRSATRAR